MPTNNQYSTLPRASDLRDRVLFQSRGEVSEDALGNKRRAFSDQFEEAAQLRPRLGGEAAIAGRLQGRALINVLVWASNRTRGVSTDWRIKNKRTGEFYNIRSVVDPHAGDEAHDRFIEFLCESGVEAGE